VVSHGRVRSTTHRRGRTGGALVGALSHGITRPLVDRVLPAPGSGPGPKARAAGWFRDRFVATTSTGATYHATVAGSGDPGYAATAVMLGESVLCLALEGDRLPERTGSLTPATAMGLPLVERCARRATRTRSPPADVPGVGA